MKTKLIASNIGTLPDFLLFEHGVMTFHIEGISRVVLAQLVRHRTFNFTVESLRYTEPGESMATIPYVDLTMPNGEQIESEYIYGFVSSFEAYQNLRSNGVVKQDARYVLPLGVKTNLMLTMPLKHAPNFFQLRLHKSAQPEIRALATLLFDHFYFSWIETNPDVLKNNEWNKAFELWLDASNDAQVVYYMGA